jgi:hypothetical protein
VAHLEARLQELKYSLDMIPAHLRQWTSATHHDSSVAVEEQAARTSQFASMRANLHVTHLWLQSIIIDQLDAAAQCVPAAGPSILGTRCGSSSSSINTNSGYEQGTNPNSYRRQALWAHREEICRQLQHVLHAIPERDLEPNGMHLTFKVRDMAVGLLACPYEGRDDLASKRAAEYIGELTMILSRPDHSEKKTTVNLQSWADTDRVRRGLDGYPRPAYGEWWKGENSRA